eukprot:GHVR01120268.1.p1 GENE.GHVR01120268.1~~GHVR01120268.1.p1  ORF type:complete len:101 (-),score=0.85 GHVR01120268.1:1769-2071(-)
MKDSRSKYGIIKDSRTVSINKNEHSKKKSFLKEESLYSKHLKTMEREWDPIETKKVSIIKGEGKTTKMSWIKKKRSVTESQSKKPIRLFPSQIEVYHRPY